MYNDCSTHEPFTRHHWLTKVRKSLLMAVVIVTLSLGVGVLGYHRLGGLSWIDSLLEASMILGGMGPVAPMETEGVKLFASFYALFSGLILLSTTGILLAPFLQRMFYHTHRQARRDAILDETGDS